MKTESTKRKRMKWNPSIRSRLFAAFLIILLIPTISLGVISYQKSKTEITEQFMKNTRQSVQSVDSQLTDMIQSSFDDLDYLSKTVKGGMVQGEASPRLRQILDPVKAVKAQYDHVQFATTDGKLLNSPQQKFDAGFDPRERQWYKDAISQKGTALVNSPIVGQDGKVIVVPSKASEDSTGVVSVVLSLDHLAAQTNAIKVGEKGYVTILDSANAYLTHPEIAAGTENAESYASRLDGQASGEISFASGGQDKIAVYATNEKTGWKIVGVINKSEIAAANHGILITTVIIIVAAVVLGMLLTWWVVRSINNPLKKLVRATQKIAGGELSEEVPVDSRDELGHLASSVNEMRQNLRGLIEQIGFHAEQVAATSEELSASAEQTRSTSDHIASSIQEIADGSERQVRSSEEFAQSVREISGGMEGAAASIQFVSELTGATNGKAQEGNEVVQKTVGQMQLIQASTTDAAEVVNALGRKTSEIGAIVGLITEIASQTNLLALNAAIEAARAGEHGRGFAIVADEVRKLAEQSAGAAGSITALIGEIQTESERAVRSMREGTEVVEEGIQMVSMTGAAFEDILSSIGRVADEASAVAAIVEQVNVSSAKMVEGVEGMAGIAAQASGSTQGVAASTQQQSASMAEVSYSSEELSRMAQELQEVIGKFSV
ncbi:methyl-accepting chemotaxis protein [Saccharibacillus alkalitolerans]|uniref:Methyl-accepting chemotaxis protein n=1 Tax=Saccharibacillus alkalitolerans TaxID=2705290 RepID=A0ABX0FBA3_9BACL|nr:methyl-accepting chemotaxis protein [Saccharibacillus alkalitolerans]NGZ77548.1 methyl-accepting chemotaxis protein [Saccharibacillus alkalitolerans]